MALLIDRLVKIRKDLVRLGRDPKVITAYAGTDNLEVSRMLDSIIENAAFLRGMVEHGLEPGQLPRPRTNRLIKSLRKTLGYTYP